MKKIFKSVVAGAAAAIVAFSSTTVFAVEPIEEITGPSVCDSTKKVPLPIKLDNGITYQTTAYGCVYDKRYDYGIREFTQVDHTVSSVYVGAQVVRYDTGANFGSKQEDELKNTSGVQIDFSIAHAAPIGKFTVFGAHTAFVNGNGGGKVAEIYTTTYSFKR